MYSNLSKEDHYIKGGVELRLVTSLFKTDSTIMIQHDVLGGHRNIYQATLRLSNIGLVFSKYKLLLVCTIITEGSAIARNFTVKICMGAELLVTTALGFGAFWYSYHFSNREIELESR